MATFLILYIYLHPTRLRGTLTPPNHMPLWHTVFQNKKKQKKTTYWGMAHSVTYCLNRQLKLKT